MHLAASLSGERPMLTGGVLPDSDFMIIQAQRAEPRVWDRSAEGASMSAAQFPPAEIRAAAARIVAESGDSLSHTRRI